MRILVQNCFHWIGYQYVNYLLEQGMVVKGVDKINNDKKENLYMLVGRNSSFELIDSVEQVDGMDVAIVVGEIEQPQIANCKRILHIQVGNSLQSVPNSVVIYPPILFGEWMEMSEKGIYHNGRFVAFDSEEFRKDAVHILDFIQATLPLFNSTIHSKRIDVYSKKVYLNEAVKLDNSIFIRDNIPIEVHLKKLIAHYRRHQLLY